MTLGYTSLAIASLACRIKGCIPSNFPLSSGNTTLLHPQSLPSFPFPVSSQTFVGPYFRSFCREHLTSQSLNYTFNFVNHSSATPSIRLSLHVSKITMSNIPSISHPHGTLSDMPPKSLSNSPSSVLADRDEAHQVPTLARHISQASYHSDKT
jgi:hypothetical protein